MNIGQWTKMGSVIFIEGEIGHIGHIGHIGRSESANVRDCF